MVLWRLAKEWKQKKQIFVGSFVVNLCKVDTVRIIYATEKSAINRYLELYVGNLLIIFPNALASLLRSVTTVYDAENLMNDIQNLITNQVKDWIF